jgi:copper chaperone CopZ
LFTFAVSIEVFKIHRVMKVNSGLILLVVLIISSCSTDQSQVLEKNIEKVEIITEVDTESKTIANFGIEGMACEKACGGSIKKALMNMDGVIAADIKFDVNNDVDFAVVEFDDSKVSSEQMAQKLSELNKGQFTVKSIAVDKQVKKGSTKSEVKEDAPAKSASGVGEVRTKSFELPNILNILNRFLR